jgi:hypothetical protein
MLRRIANAEIAMRIWRARRLAGWGAWLLGAWLAAATPPAVSQSSGDQVIVKFREQSEAGQILSRLDLGAIADPAGDVRLTEVARELGERIGVPLRLESLTSGRELLLGIDYRQLAGALAERLRGRADIASVAVADPGRADEAPRLEVEFEPESAFAKLLETGPRVALEPAAGLGEIQAEVATSDRSRAVLTLDRDALMSAVLARIEADPDVLYAQSNLRMRPYRAEAGAQG